MTSPNQPVGLPTDLRSPGHAGENLDGAGTLRVIDGDSLRRLVPMSEAIEASAEGFTALARGDLSSPKRSRLSRDRALLMSAEHESGSAVVKLISLHADGWSTGLPSMEGVVAWIGGPSGRVEALIEASALTALRTGAASGLATSLLADDSASVLAMLGAGGIAADQIEAVRAVRPIGEVRLWSRSPARAEAMCELLRASAPATSFVPVSSSRAAVRGADVVCTATRAAEPLFAAGDLQPTAHVNAVGAYRHDMRELPAEAFAIVRIVVVDQVDAALHEAGDLIAAIDAGAIGKDRLVTIADLLGKQGDPPVGGRPVGLRRSETTGPSIFKSVGVAAQDWAIARLIVQRAEQRR